MSEVRMRKEAVAFAPPQVIFGVSTQVYAIALVRFCDALGNSFFFVILPLYVGKFYQASTPIPEELLIGILIALYGVVAAGLQPLVGWLSDRIGRRKVFIVAGLVLLTVATFGFTLAGSYLDLALLRCLQGVGVALNVPTSFALISAYSKRSNRAASTAVYTTARHLGFGIGPLLAGFLYINFGPNDSFLIAALLVLIGTILFVLSVKEAPGGEESHSSPPGFRFLLSQKGLPALSGVSVLIAVTVVLLMPLEKEIILRLHLTAVDFGMALSALLLGRLLLQFPLGKLADRVGRKPIILSGLLLLCPSAFAAGSGALLVLALLLQGLALAGYFFFELPFVVLSVASLLCLWAVYRGVEDSIGGETAGAPADAGEAG